MSDRTFTIWSLFTPLALGTKVRRQAPCCRSCRRSDFIVYWGRVAGLFALIAIGISVIDPWLRSLGCPRPFRRWIGGALLIVAILPAILWTYVFPRPITLDASKDTVDYQFKHRDYAEDFAALNESFVQ